jgi:hypothetical protein
MQAFVTGADVIAGERPGQFHFMRRGAVWSLRRSREKAKRHLAETDAQEALGDMEDLQAAEGCGCRGLETAGRRSFESTLSNSPTRTRGAGV